MNPFKRLAEVARSIYVHQYKYFLIATLFLVCLSIGVLLHQYATTGSFVHKGISLTGGISVRFDVDAGFNVKQFETGLRAKFPEADMTIRELRNQGVLESVSIEAGFVTAEELQSFLESYLQGTPKNLSVQEFGAEISQAFFDQILIAVLFAFLSMAVVVFITFRDIVPSGFVVLCAFSTIISTLAVSVLINFRMSSGGIAAILMLIGYSVDTDILLTTRVLKRHEGGTIVEKVFNSMRTGLNMTLTAMAAVTIALFFSTSDTIREIMLLLFIGLCFDIIYTWFQNATILRWHMERIGRHDGEPEPHTHHATEVRP